MYNTALSCGKYYLGFNKLIVNHEASLKGEPCSNQSSHCRECGCAPLFDDTVVKARFRDTVVREIEEAYLVNKAGGSCVL
uniref:Putative tick transposon n=1 Tax=Rhipicephalus microplus TaxID=6941 RepID=A0A6G5AJ70_RHIMP